jgi:hypothetical protein
MNLKPFWSWCTAKGIKTPLKVQWKPSDGGTFRYTVLQQPQPPPLHSDEDNSGAGLFNLIQCPLRACLIASSTQELADRLLFEVSLGPDSEYFPYISVLPPVQDLFDLPRFWSPTRLEMVTDGGFLQRALIDDASRLSDALSTIRQGSENEEEENYLWALAIVDSRANFLPDGRYALTPVLDMINHNAFIPTSARVIRNKIDPHEGSMEEEEDESIFHLNVPTRSIRHNTKDDDEVRISYGELGNLQTLVQYGFVEAHNPFNTEVVKVPVFRQQSPVYVTVDANGSIDSISLSALRKSLATDSELEGCFTKNENQGSRLLVPVLSSRNEIETHALIGSYLEESIHEAQVGVTCAASGALVRSYLLERAQTLQRGLDRIQEKFPQIWDC